VPFIPMNDVRQGIVHIIGPELGLTQPGMTIVCGDSHTSTHGAFGALAFGIGTSEVEHVLATQTLYQRPAKNMRVTVEGPLPVGTTAKDLILAIIGRLGTAGATGHVIEYAGEAIRALSMEGRMTICNMSIEAGARAGLIAPDETTFEYLKGRVYVPKGAAWEQAVELWRSLPSDEGARYDREVTLSASEIAPLVTWGTSPEDVLPITDQVPGPESARDENKAKAIQRSLAYMGLTPGMKLTDVKIDKVFIGSCTNGRIEDLREVAQVVEGRRVAYVAHDNIDAVGEQLQGRAVLGVGDEAAQLGALARSDQLACHVLAEPTGGAGEHDRVGRRAGGRCLLGHVVPGSGSCGEEPAG